MNCPVCNVALTMTDRQGVEIDYCPKCRGVWLDRGELDKIIERSAVGSAPQQFQSDTQYNPPRDSHQDSHHDNRGHYENQHNYKQHDDYKYKKKKKESFLSELFDF